MAASKHFSTLVQRLIPTIETTSLGMYQGPMDGLVAELYIHRQFDGDTVREAMLTAGVTALVTSAMQEVQKAKKIGGKITPEALVNAMKTAYKAVQQPVEEILGQKPNTLDREFDLFARQCTRIIEIVSEEIAEIINFITETRTTMAQTGTVDKAALLAATDKKSREVEQRLESSGRILEACFIANQRVFEAEVLASMAKNAIKSNSHGRQ